MYFKMYSKHRVELALAEVVVLLKALATITRLGTAIKGRNYVC